MFDYPKHYDVVVVGGGHAGIEASLACSRMGCDTLMLTINADTIGKMSCNPAIGGLAKGHLVREIDALGGQMGMATDHCGIQFRMLNATRGPAVLAPRAQCDKWAYQAYMRSVCERQARLDVFQDSANEILFKDGKVLGVSSALGIRFNSTIVILTTGTFLRGLMHVGDNRSPGGRLGEPSADSLSASLKSIGLEIGRLKTGTPPRLLKQSIDFSKTEEQRGDEPPPKFSFWDADLFHMEQSSIGSQQATSGQAPRHKLEQFIKLAGQIPCYITRTTDQTANLIRSNLHHSPLFTRRIEGTGPRYCPSIEDKVVRFADKAHHQIFLEPEGVDSEEIYVNGFSTSLPFEIQIELVRTIIGCEGARILRPGYAVEYDFVFPTQLKESLETRACEGLFLAGQINGTSGYEEAAAQGIMAGINAVMKLHNQPPLILRRDQAYIGVLIDDLVTLGTTEPYRMFTSRAEYRLLLRQDNADLRLAAIGRDMGLLPDSCFRSVESKREAVATEMARLQKARSSAQTLFHLLKRPGMRYQDLPSRNDALHPEVMEQIEIEAKYAGYIERQLAEVAKVKAMQDKHIPDGFDYNSLPSLRLEARQKLAKLRPGTLGQASRISGVSPADISVLMVWLKRSDVRNL